MRRRVAIAGLPLLLAACLLGPAGLEGQEPKPPPKEELAPGKTSCFYCHAELDPEGPTQHFPDGVHFHEDLGCHGCHGGNPKAGFDGDPFAAHDEEMGFQGAPARKDIPLFCATCHSDPNLMKRFDPHARVDQLDEYRTSHHGVAVLEEGDDRAAVCTDCHGVHGIRSPSDPRAPVHPTHVADTCAHCHADPELMGHYKIPVSPFSEYKQSVHARALYEKGDLSAPTCNDCHGNHGAVPPGVESVANICGTCHTREASLFRETEQKFDLNLTLCIRCVICHANHAVLPPTDEMLGVGPQSTCTACHAPGEKAYVASAEMRTALDVLKETLAEAQERLHEAERAGMEVSQDLFELQEAKDKIVELHVLAHSFDSKRYLDEASKGLEVAEAGMAAGHRAFEELRFRRLGLAASLIVIALVILSLILKIRQMEKP